MKPVLMLTHRIPDPPDKGDKLRAYHWLRQLSRSHRVFLACFVDDPADWAHVDTVRAWCSGIEVVRFHPGWARMRAAAAWVAGRSLTEGAYWHRGLARWVDDTVRREGIDTALVYCSAMAPYVMGRPGLRAWMDFVDVDSAKWAQYAAHRPMLSGLYRREALRLAQLEQRAAESAQAVFFVTPAEAELFAGMARPVQDKIRAVGNGVDAEYFSPACPPPSPFEPNEQAVAFTGVMDYWPNVDAVSWFVREVWPTVAARHARARFYVVGMRPAAAVRALANDRVRVTGRVEDVRPYLAHAALAVAPLRIARGVQNKVLEAMAMGRAVVATNACAAGLAARADEELAVAADAAQFAQWVSVLLGSPQAAQQMGAAARERVMRDYSWPAQWRQLAAALESAA